MTPGVFAFAAQNYLARYFSSSFMLRRALERRAMRFIRKHGGTMEEARPLIDAEVQKHIKSGGVDDLLFAKTMTAELQKSGDSSLKIKQKLFKKGIPSSIIDQVLKESENNPRKAALRYAKKRGFGPYRAPHITTDRKQKELASMVRAGHSYGISKEILALSREEADEDDDV